MEISISDSESSKISTFDRDGIDENGIDERWFLLVNSDKSSDNSLVMMALLVDQLGNDQTQESFY